MATVLDERTDELPPDARRAGTLLDRIWADRRISFGVAAGVAALVGLLAAGLMPRGPITTGQALTAMAVGAATGAAVGVVSRSRWAMLLAPAAYAAAFEIGTIGEEGPTVDAPRFDTFFGTLASVVGRGWHGLVVILPMVVAASVAVGIVRRRGPDGAPPTGWGRFGLWARRGFVAAGVVIVIGLAALIARPAWTEPIVGADGEPLPGSIAELATVDVGGAEQAVMIRGHNVDAPVVLYLAGGPITTDIGYARAFFGGLEEDFVVAVWDQRGAGKSYPALEPTDAMTLETAVADTVAVTDYLRDRFDRDRIYILGNSWGSIPSLLAARDYPERYHAYVGMGQMVDIAETDRRLYHQVVDLAVETGDTALAEQMEGYGEPPYGDLFAYSVVLEHYPELEPYPEFDAFHARTPGWVFGNAAVEFDLVDKVNVMRGLADTFFILYPDLQELDLRVDVPRVEVPVYMIHGAHELTARGDLALAWFDRLAAPSKELIVFEHSGHTPQWEEPERFHDVMTSVVLAEIAGESSP